MPNPYLLSVDPMKKYRNPRGALFTPHATQGLLTVVVAPELCGIPLRAVHAAALQALDPSHLRVIGPGETAHTDWRPGRVTIYVDEHDLVSRIEREGWCGYTDGESLSLVLEELRSNHSAS